MGSYNSKEGKSFVILEYHEDKFLKKIIQNFEDEIIFHEKRQPSEETQEALDFVSNYKKSSLQQINNIILDIQKESESEFKNQTLILLRHLYLIKSNQIESCID